jgi:glutathione S-transferase
MKLYYSPGACSLASHICLREAGAPVDLVKVDLGSKKTETGGDFRAVNALGYVPVLELDDGTRLTEGPAIMQWIADQFPQAGLAPAAGSLARTRLQSWLNFISTEVHKGFSPLFNPDTPDAYKEMCRNRLATRLDYVNEELGKRSYLTGERFSVADAYLFVCSGWGQHVGVDIHRWPNLVAFRARVAGRAAVQAALKAEGLA